MTEKIPHFLKLTLVTLLALVLGACDADSPTAPSQTPNPPPPTSATTTFSITVSLSPGTVESGAETPVTVTVTARRTDTYQPVPRGSTAVLSTTSGLLTNAAGTAGVTVTITFDVNGAAQAILTVPTQTAIVRAQIEQSFGQATLTVTEAPEVVPFSLLGVNPAFGPPAGSEVRIEGTGISLPTDVFFDGIPAQILDVKSTYIRARTPAIDLPSGQNRTVTVRVDINVGEPDADTDTLTSGFTYTRNQTAVVPKIISVTPTSGPNEGGTPVTIFGEAFGSEVQVFFGATSLIEAFGSEVQVFFGATSLIEARLLEVSSTRIRVETPPATGQNSQVQNSVVAVRVVDLRSGFEAVLPSAFQYGRSQDNIDITAIQPSAGIYLGGTLVTIFSTGGFEAPVTVGFGGEAQQVVSVSGTEVVARSVSVSSPGSLGCGSQSGAVTVVNIETGESGSGPSFQYRAVRPLVGSVSPSSTTVDVDTGAIVFGSPTTTTISGGGFDRQTNPPRVTIGGEQASDVTITSLDPDPFYTGHAIGDVMSVRIPPFRGEFAEVSCTVGADSGMRYVNTEVDVVVTARDTGCSGTLADAFTYVPDDTSCRVPPPDPVAPVAQFSFTIAGTEVTFRDLSSNAPTSIEWDFGDGAVETGFPGETRVHDYGAGASGMDFMVILTATNAAGSGQITKTVSIP